MERCKEILKKLFVLPALPTILISLPSFAFVFFVLGTGIGGTAAYVSYGLSAYAMVIATTGVIRVVRAFRSGIHQQPLVKKLLNHPFGGRYVRDGAFRTEVSLYTSLGINLLYAAMKMVSGILFDSVWFITLAVYYGLLAVMRFLLMVSARKRHEERNLEAEWKRYRLCGILLSGMTLALSGMVLLLVRQDGGYDYPGILIYAMALYAFYAVIMAVVHLIRFRKRGSPVLSAAKAINLTAALISMLALETAMLHQFGQENSLLFWQAMTAATGAGVCGLVLAMAVYMIVHGTEHLKSMNLTEKR